MCDAVFNSEDSSGLPASYKTVHTAEEVYSQCIASAAQCARTVNMIEQPASSRILSTAAYFLLQLNLPTPLVEAYTEGMHFSPTILHNYEHARQ